jgi:hypothetical protein
VELKKHDRDRIDAKNNIIMDSDFVEVKKNVLSCPLILGAYNIVTILRAPK